MNKTISARFQLTLFKEETMEFKKHIVGVMLFAAVLSATSVLSAGDKKTTSVGPQQVQPKILAEFGIPRDGSDLITIPITLKSGPFPLTQRKRTYRFLLDMGSSTVSTFDVTLRDQLGEALGKRTVTLAGGRIQTFEYFRWPDAKIGKLSVDLKSTVACNDFQDIRRRWRLPFHGVLSLDFWKKHVFRLDFDRGKLTILSAAPSDSGTQIPIEFSKGGSPLISVQLPGNQESKCLLSPTPSATMLLHPDRFNKLVSEGHLHTAGRPRDIPIAIGKWYEGRGALDRVKVGRFTHRAVSVASAINKENYDAVGLKFFARYRVTVDLPNKCLYLKKGAGFDRIDSGQQSGMFFEFKVNDKPAPINDKPTPIVVHKVLDGTPAQKAGFLPGDVITHINNEDVSKLSIFRISELRAISGKVTMTVKRDNKELSLTMIPKDEPEKKVKQKTAKKK